MSDYLGHDSLHYVTREGEIMCGDGGTIMLRDQVSDLTLARGMEAVALTQVGPPEYVSPGYGGLPRGLSALG